MQTRKKISARRTFLRLFFCVLEMLAKKGKRHHKSFYSYHRALFRGLWPQYIYSSTGVQAKLLELAASFSVFRLAPPNERHHHCLCHSGSPQTHFRMINSLWHSCGSSFPIATPLPPPPSAPPLPPASPNHYDFGDTTHTYSMESLKNGAACFALLFLNEVCVHHGTIYLWRNGFFGFGSKRLPSVFMHNMTAGIK